MATPTAYGARSADAIALTLSGVLAGAGPDPDIPVRAHNLQKRAVS